jgi:hypothetical protein
MQTEATGFECLTRICEFNFSEPVVVGRILCWRLPVQILEIVPFACETGCESYDNHAADFPDDFAGALFERLDRLFIHRLVCFWRQPLGYRAQPGWPGDGVF